MVIMYYSKAQPVEFMLVVLPFILPRSKMDSVQFTNSNKSHCVMLPLGSQNGVDYWPVLSFHESLVQNY